MIRKARNWRAFLIERRKFFKSKNGWLGRKDSNHHIPESIFVFDMSGEFRPKGRFSLPETFGLSSNEIGNVETITGNGELADFKEHW